MNEMITVPIEDLQLDPKNSRIHGEENIQAIQNSLERFGQVLPLVIWKGIVKGGNGTLQAMRRLKFTEAKIVEFDGSEEDALALGITLNRTAELADWDLERLGGDLVTLYDAGYTPEAIGFSAPALDGLFPEEDAEFRVAQPDIEKQDPEKKSLPLGNPVIQYALIFDDEDQQKRFFALLRELKQRYPDSGTNAARLDRFISEATSGTRK